VRFNTTKMSHSCVYIREKSNIGGKKKYSCLYFETRAILERKPKFATVRLESRHLVNMEMQAIYGPIRIVDAYILHFARIWLKNGFSIGRGDIKSSF